MGMQFEEVMRGMTSPQEQADYLAQALRYCAEHVLSPRDDGKTEELERRLSELEAQNQVLTDRLEKAKDYFRESKNSLDSAEERTKAIISRNLQKTKDEIYVLGSALHALAVSLAEKPTSKMTLVEVNNLQDCITGIIENLQENGLWNADLDSKPDLTIVEKAAKPRAPRKTKKKDDSGEQIAMTEPDQVQAEE